MLDLAPRFNRRCAFLNGKSPTGTIGGYLSVTAAPITAAPLTIAVRLRNIRLGGNTPVYVSLHNSGSAGNRNCFQIGHSNTAGIPQAFTGAGSGGTGAAALQALNSNWNSVVGVFASSTSRTCYLNCSPGNTNSTSRVPSGIDTIAIGVEPASTLANPFSGSIAHAALWNVALSWSEICAYSRGLSPLKINRGALVAYWPLLEGGRDIGSDIVGGFDLVATGVQGRAPGPFGRGSQFLLDMPAALIGLTSIGGGLGGSGGGINAPAAGSAG